MYGLKLVSSRNPLKASAYTYSARYMYNTKFTAQEQQSLSASDLESPQQKHPSYTPARSCLCVHLLPDNIY